MDRETPELPSSPPIARDAPATLTVLTGSSAGQTVSLDGIPVTIGRAADSDLAVDEIGVSRHHARIVHNAGGGYRVEDLHSTNGTFIGTARVGFALLERDAVLQLGPELRIGFTILPTEPAVVPLPRDERAYLDPITSVFNRSSIMERLGAEVARARHANEDMALLMLGVDSLRSVNEHFGRFAGDRTLAAVAARVQRVLRAEDALGRHDGDEFLVLALGTNRSDAVVLAENIRRAVAGLHMNARGREVRVTASIGVASLGELAAGQEGASSLLAISEQRMLAAKSAGRNQVSTMPPARR